MPHGDPTPRLQPHRGAPLAATPDGGLGEPLTAAPPASGTRRTVRRPVAALLAGLLALGWVLAMGPLDHPTAFGSAGAARSATDSSCPPAPTPTSGAIVPAVVAPSQCSLVADAASLSVQVTSIYQISGVAATAGSHTVQLAYDGATQRWSGVVPVAGLARGPQAITVVATDVFGTTGQTVVSVVHDTPPAIAIVAAPAADSVVGLSVRLAATCADDDPAGCSLLVAGVGAGAYPLGCREDLAGQASVDGTVSAAAYDGFKTDLCFAAKDSAGQVVQTTRTVYVIGSPKLSAVAIVPGMLLDVAADRLLYAPRAANSALAIRDRASGRDTAVALPSGMHPVYGYLASRGAILVAQSGDGTTARVYDVADGVVTDLGPGGAVSLQVAGRYAVFANGDALLRRDLSTGTNVQVTSLRGGARGAPSAAVAANGDVVYSDGDECATYRVWRYRGGQTTQLTTDTTGSQINPITDGTDVVYAAVGATCCFPTKCWGPYGLSMVSDAGTTVLAAPRQLPLVPGTDYRVANGYVAFARDDGQGTAQVWLRSPGGGLRQVSVFSTSTTLDGLSPTGEVMLRNRGDRYLPRVSGPAVDLGPALGTSYSIDGTWYVAVGDTLLAVDPDAVATPTPTPVPHPLYLPVVDRAAGTS